MKNKTFFSVLLGASLMCGNVLADAPEPLTFSNTGCDCTIAILDNCGVGLMYIYPNLQYSTNGTDWIAISSFDDTTINTTKLKVAYIPLAAGESVQFKGVNPNGLAGCYYTSTPKGLLMEHPFSIAQFHIPSGQVAVSGDIMSLINDSMALDTIPNATYEVDVPLRGTLVMHPWAFYGVFSGCDSLVDASALQLPVKTLSPYCYRSMFEGCKNLKSAPVISAEKLASNCCRRMFVDCRKLEATPALPAMELADSCYMNMFGACTGLTNVPDTLPAVKLADFCYGYMFEGDSSLVNTPVLPATELAPACYSGMFADCSSLTTAPELKADKLANSCYSNMFNGCCNLTIAPELNATTLDTACYLSMFTSCKKLSKAPVLPATTLVQSCYQTMFTGCSSLTSLTVKFTDWNAAGYSTHLWLQNKAIEFHCPIDLPISKSLTGAWGGSVCYIPPMGTVYKIIEQDDPAVEAKLAVAQDTTSVYKNYTINRPIRKDGTWTTICLPFNLDANALAASPLAGYSDLKAFESADVVKDTLLLCFSSDNQTTIQAGVPYIIKWNSGTSLQSIDFKNVDIAASVPDEVGNSPVKFMGTFSPDTVGPESEMEDGLLLESTGKVYLPTKNSVVNGFRAYFQIIDSQVADAVRSGLNVALYDGKVIPTSVQNVRSDLPVIMKLIEQGRVVIVSEGVRYNLNGQIIQ